MPTPDPSLIPALITSGATLFTSNWTVMVTGAIALIGIVTLPTGIAKAVLSRGTRALLSVVRVGRH